MDTKDASSLDSLLDGAAPVSSREAVDETPSQAPEQPTAAAIETGEKDKAAAPPAEANIASPAPIEAEAPLVPRKALEDERRKRQARDKEFEDLQRQFAAMQAQSQQPQQPPPQEQIEQPPDPWIDPQGALEYQRRQFEHQIYETRLFASEEIVRPQVPDYDELVQTFVQEARTSPTLQRQLASHPFPAKFVVETARKIKLVRDVGSDPEAYRKRIIDEYLSQQQNADPAQPQQAPKVSVPKSLAGTPSAQPRNAKGQWTGPASLDDILGG